MTYDYVTWEEDGTWSSHVPSIPGVYGLGDTAEEAEEDLVEALEALSGSGVLLCRSWEEA